MLTGDEAGHVTSQHAWMFDLNKRAAPCGYSFVPQCDPRKITNGDEENPIVTSIEQCYYYRECNDADKDMLLSKTGKITGSCTFHGWKLDDAVKKYGNEVPRSGTVDYPPFNFKP